MRTEQALETLRRRLASGEMRCTNLRSKEGITTSNLHSLPVGPLTGDTSAYVGIAHYRDTLTQGILVLALRHDGTAWLLPYYDHVNGVPISMEQAQALLREQNSPNLADYLPELLEAIQ